MAAVVRAKGVRDESIPGFLMPSIETTLVIKSRETSERLAMGCSVKGIVAIVVKESVWLAGAGGVGVARMMRELLYGVGPLDGATLLGVVSLVGMVALGAAGVVSLVGGADGSAGGAAE